MRKRIIIFFAVLLVLLLATAVASADPGHNPDQLVKAGYTCFPTGDFLWTHCLKKMPGPDGPPTVQVKVFDTDGTFLGTELLVRPDIYNEQPCPQDGGGPYDFPFGPDGYRACHHFERPPLP